MTAPPYHPNVEFEVLGPLVVRGPRGIVDVVGGKERMLLAHLVSAAGRLVTVDELTDSLWGERLPRAPGKALQTYVLRLRNALEPERRGVATLVVTEGAGYRLAVRDQDVDAHRFATLAARGRQALASSRPGEAAVALRQADDLWRGPAYAGFEETPFGRAERQRLDELRVSATEDRWAAEVDLGRAAAAIPELERLVAEHPWRERAWGTLVLALCRTGRQGDALAALDRARHRLAEDLGVDPGPELRELQRRVLAHDPDLLRLPQPPVDVAEPVDPLVAVRVREAAAAVVREESGAVAAAGHALRDGRASLAEGLYVLESGAEPGTLPSDFCPWRGLASYDVDDRPWFAGRERLVAELLARVSADRLVAVVGASGSGKSSLARAGLVGALAEGALPGSWTTIVMRPGAAPMTELASKAIGATQAMPSLGDLLLRLAEGGTPEHRTVLVVDQLEEVWTACTDEHERAAFLDALTGIAHETETRVVLVVRADYVASLAEHAGIAGLARDATVLVGSPTTAEVRRMVEVPARRAGLLLEPGLAETVSDDAADEPGLLPLLSTSLMQLWERRSQGRLTYAEYVGLGGLSGAVAHLAEEAYDALGADQAMARVVLLRLAGRVPGGGVVRRRVSWAELEGLRGNAVEVVATLAGARLLTVDDDAVEVAHESLFREWPRLAGWLADDESTRSVQHRLAVAAGQWEEQGRDPGLLWRGAGLQSALEVVAAYPEETTRHEQDFLAAGEALLEAEQREAEDRASQRERQNRSLRTLLVVAAVLLALAIVAGLVALASRRDTAEARDAAEARRLAAASLNEESLDLALLQAVEAVRAEPGPQTHGALLTLLARTPDLLHLRRGETPFLQAAASPDGRVVAVSEYDPRVVALDASTGAERWTRQVPDGGHVGTLDGGARGFLAATWNDSGSSAVHLWDPATGRHQWTLTREDLAAVVGPEGDPQPGEAAWDRDGRVVVLTPTHLVTASAEGRPLKAIELAAPGPTGRLEAWPDGRISYESPTDVGHVVGPAGEVKLDFTVQSVSPDGKLVLTADRSSSEATRLQLRSSKTFRPVGEEMTISSFDNGVDWAADGTFAIGAGEAVQVRSQRGRLVKELTGAHSGAVMAPVFGGSEDSVLWAAGRDALISGWDLTGNRGLLETTALERGAQNGQASGDGTIAAGMLFSVVEPNGAGLLEGSRTNPLTMPECECQVASVAITPDGSRALGSVIHFTEGPPGYATDAGRLLVWDTARRELLHDVALPWNPISASLFADGTRALVNGGGGLAVVDLSEGKIVRFLELPRYEAPNIFRSVAVRDDDSVAAALRADGVVLLDPWSAKVRKERALDTASATAAEGTALAWAGDVLVVAGLDGRLSFLDGNTLEPVAPPREAAAGFVIDLLSLGDTLASLGSDGDVRLWDVGTWQPVGLPLMEENVWGFLSGSAAELAVWFEAADGNGAGPGRVRRLALRPDAWLDRACSLVSRQLTRDEWAVIHPDEEWRETCPAPVSGP